MKKSSDGQKTKSQQIAELVLKQPELSVKDIADKLGVKANLVHQVRWKLKKTKPVKPAKQVVATPKKAKKSLAHARSLVRALQSDMVNHPPHYKVGGIETIDFIEAKGLDYNLGNVVKYITRAEHKGSRVQDLMKARWYLNRAIESEK